MHWAEFNCGMLFLGEPSRVLEHLGFTGMLLIVGVREYVFWSQIFMATVLA